jgi:glyoxylase I family protein
MPRPVEAVTGIGGLFFRAKDPDALGTWYRDHLGVNLIPDGNDTTPWTQEAGPTAFTPFPEESDYFPKDHVWMINFRVRDLDAMVAQLTRAGVTVTVDPEAQSFGRFARLVDPEGNPIELWEPK